MIKKWSFHKSGETPPQLKSVDAPLRQQHPSQQHQFEEPQHFLKLQHFQEKQPKQDQQNFPEQNDNLRDDQSQQQHQQQLQPQQQPQQQLQPQQQHQQQLQPKQQIENGSQINCDKNVNIRQNKDDDDDDDDDDQRFKLRREEINKLEDFFRKGNDDDNDDDDYDGGFASNKNNNNNNNMANHYVGAGSHHHHHNNNNNGAGKTGNGLADAAPLVEPRRSCAAASGGSKSSDEDVEVFVEKKECLSVGGKRRQCSGKTLHWLLILLLVFLLVVMTLILISILVTSSKEKIVEREKSEEEEEEEEGKTMELKAPPSLRIDHAKELFSSNPADFILAEKMKEIEKMIAAHVNSDGAKTRRLDRLERILTRFSENLENSTKASTESLRALEEVVDVERLRCPNYSYVAHIGLKTCYLFPGIAKDWNEAQNYCQNEGGFLAEPKTHEENAFLISEMRHWMSTESWWLGGQRIDPVGQTELGRWAWQHSRENFDYQNWGEQHKEKRPYRCLLYYNYDRIWTSYDCQSTRKFVCQANFV